MVAKRTGPYDANGLEFWVNNCTIWYDSDGDGHVETNVTWQEFKNDPAHAQATKDAVEAQLDALGCQTP